MSKKERVKKDLTPSQLAHIKRKQVQKEEEMSLRKELKELVSKQTTDNNIRFAYFGNLDQCIGTGKIVVAFNDQHMGISFCSPKDMYSKVDGKVRAIERLLNHPIELSLTKEKPVYIQVYEAIHNYPFNPGWIKHIHLLPKK